MYDLTTHGTRPRRANPLGRFVNIISAQPSSDFGPGLIYLSSLHSCGTSIVCIVHSYDKKEPQLKFHLSNRAINAAFKAWVQYTWFLSTDCCSE